MSPFLISFTLSLVASITWTQFVLRTGAGKWRHFGLCGAWVSTLVLAAFWQANHSAWVGQMLGAFLKLVVMIWMLALTGVLVEVAKPWFDTLSKGIKLKLEWAPTLAGAFVFAAGMLGGGELLWLAMGPGGV